ncbi:nucleoside-diphosphate kinase [Candidatus Woesearchaeota archaeon]|nr:nucleoside-diphosphate kinase [Candidatus Woesearchaeota archaeon]MBW3018122.1 nucleoside-diphosphate kinase [Candidatus Woesearchaeota archaeon]
MMERTLILAKPDAVQRGLVGEIIKRFEQKGFKIAGIKMVHPNEQQLGEHYADDPVWKKETGEKTIAAAKKRGEQLNETAEEIGARVRRWNMDGLKINPIVAIVFEGYHAVEIGRKIVGPTEPKAAPPGTIRGDFSVDSYPAADKDQRVLRTLVHASGSKEEAEREIKVWFSEEELFNYEKKEWEIIHGTWTA